jgi:hypothetical protein
MWLIVALCLAGPSPAAERTVPVAGGTATVAIPDGWVALPTHTLRMHSLFGLDSPERLSMTHWTDAFRPDPSVEPVPFPTVVVEVYETGRQSWSSFAASVREAEAHRIAEGESAEPLARALLESTWTLDGAQRRFFTESVFDSSVAGPVLVSSVTVLTERGTITVHGLTRAGGPAEDLRAIDRIQQSLAVDPSVAHRWRPSDLLDDLDRIDVRIRLAVAGLLTVGGLLIAIRTVRAWNRRHR